MGYFYNYFSIIKYAWILAIRKLRSLFKSQLSHGYVTAFLCVVLSCVGKALATGQYHAKDAL